MNFHRIAVAFASVSICLLIAADAPPAVPVVKVVAIEVHNPPDKDIAGLALGEKGVTVKLLVTDPNHEILRTGRQQSKLRLTQFTDDKGTDLARDPKEISGGYGCSSFVADDLHSMIVEFDSLGILPTASASQVHLIGSIKMYSSARLKSEKFVNLAIVKGTSLRLCDAPAVISNVGPVDSWDNGKLRVVFHDTQSLTSLNSITFRKPDGTEIKSYESESSSVESTRCLAEIVDKATVEVTWWDQLQTIEVHFDLNVGLGF